MAKQHDKQFKLDAVQYYENHKDFGVRVVLVITHLMSRRKLPVSDVNYVMPKMHLMC